MTDLERWIWLRALEGRPRLVRRAGELVVGLYLRIIRSRPASAAPP